MKTNCPKQQGQAILFVVVAMTIALAVGITVSSRTLSSVSRASRSDTYNRVFSAAEGGIERVLTFTQEQLDSFVSGNLDCSSVGLGSYTDGKCLVVFNENPLPASEDKITSRAVLSASEFTYNSPEGADSYYEFTLSPGQVKEVDLRGYDSSSIDICINEPNSAVYYIGYDAEDTPSFVKNGFVPSDSSIPNENYSFTDTADKLAIRDGFYCYSADISDLTNAYGLRVKVLFASARVRIYPRGGSLPTQGYVITSVGELLQEARVQTRKVMRVYVSNPYLPAIFDFSAYTNGALQ